MELAESAEGDVWDPGPWDLFIDDRHAKTRCPSGVTTLTIATVRHFWFRNTSDFGRIRLIILWAEFHLTATTASYRTERVAKMVTPVHSPGTKRTVYQVIT